VNLLLQLGSVLRSNQIDSEKKPLLAQGKPGKAMKSQEKLGAYFFSYSKP